MYSCVMNFTTAQAQGCILADEMGLGKTLQTIALIHTLLSEFISSRLALLTPAEQSPFPNETGVSVINRQVGSD